MKRFARVRATGVPMATPFVCLNVLAANSKVFSWRTCSSISLSTFLRGCVLDVTIFKGPRLHESKKVRVSLKKAVLLGEK